MRQSLSRLVSTLMAPGKKPHDPDYVRRTATEVFAAGLIYTGSHDASEPALCGAKAVRRAEDFLDSVGHRAIHISELSSSLQISRRSLHRAFSETLGIGPIEYLRRRRLSSVYSILRRSEPDSTTVMDVAAEHGFMEFGRFAAYYRRLFDEYPMETLRKKP
jgi:AraC family ethanolamine operon transcriptional activator